MTSLCPNPSKYRHASEAAAIKARDSLEAARGIDLALKPYLCRCGAWHLGHPGQSPRHQLQQALTAGRAATRTTRRRRKR